MMDEENIQEKWKEKESKEKQKREEYETEKFSAAVKMFIVGIGILMAVIIFFNKFSLLGIDVTNGGPWLLKTSSEIKTLRRNLLIDEDITVLNGWGIARILSYVFGIYGWWKFCEKNVW